MFLDGVLAALLAASLIAHVISYFLHRGDILEYKRMLRAASDSVHAAELRSSQQIDAMLERISTAPRLDLSAASAVRPVDPEQKTFISDLPYDDERWNDYRGEPTEEEVPE